VKTLIPLLVLAFIWAGAPKAEEADLRLAVPQALEDAGFMQFLVPRFSLKTGLRITRVAEDEAAQMRFGDSGTAVFEGLGRSWHLDHVGDDRAERFLDWLTSDIGLRTIESFSGADGATFRGPKVEVAAVEPTKFEGDVGLGETLSLEKCGRCHVVNESNRMTGIGSTPSFALMRTFADWEARFATFHMLKPHPSFTLIEGITEGFDPSLPPPIVPVTMTLDDLDAILAYVSRIEPADLGAPLQFQ
jgi:mono/diheme cytochrome c family protein